MLIRLHGCAGWSSPLLFAYRLHGCAGWSSPLLFVYNKARVSHKGPYIAIPNWSVKLHLNLHLACCACIKNNLNKTNCFSTHNNFFDIKEGKLNNSLYFTLLSQLISTQINYSGRHLQVTIISIMSESFQNPEL